MAVPEMLAQSPKIKTEAEQAHSSAPLPKAGLAAHGDQTIYATPVVSDESTSSGYVAEVEFIAACFEMGRLNQAFAAIGGEPELRNGHMMAALDAVLPVLADLAERVERRVDRLTVWNVEMAGQTEIIGRDIERNWAEMRKLNLINADVRNAE